MRNEGRGSGVNPQGNQTRPADKEQMPNVRARILTERLERRTLMAIELATAAVAIDSDSELVFQSVAGDAGGNTPTVVAYSDRDSISGKGKDIYVRRFLAGNVPLGAPTIVNTTTSGSQMNPDIAVRPDGSFVVVWQSEGQDGSGWGVYGRLYDVDATPIGGEIQVAQTTSGSQIAPHVAIGGTGVGFVVSWTDSGANSGNGAIYAREFGPTGTATTNELQIAGVSGKGYGVSDIALVSRGYAVTWVVLNVDGDNDADVQTRVVDMANDTLLSVVTVNTSLPGDQAEPVIARSGSAGTSYYVAYSDASTAEATIHVRRIDDSASTTYDVVQASQDSIGNRSRPRIDTDSAGNFVIGWSQQEAETTYSSTVYRTFDAQSNATSNEIAVTDGSSIRTMMDIVMTGSGTFVDLTSIGEFSGYGLASIGTYANVIRLDGTSANDSIVAYDLDSQTIRAAVNGVAQNFVKSAYAWIRSELGDGDDTFTGGDVSIMCTVSGGAGNDSIFTGSAGDSVSGGDGNDSISTGDGSDYAIGNSGNDIMHGDAGDDTLTGSAGKDTMYGGDGNDRVAGTGSPDVIFGEAGDDRLYGDDGDDRIDGGGGKDRVYGGENNDYMVGGSSNDRLYGQNGNDTLGGGKGNDYLAGDAGIDTVLGKEPGDTVVDVEVLA